MCGLRSLGLQDSYTTGVKMARVADNVLPSGVELGVTLDRYAELMRIPINNFNGLNDPSDDDNDPNFWCTTVWKQRQRDVLAIYLAQAEEIRRREMSFHMAPKYSGLVDVEYASPIMLEDKWLVKVGKKVTSDIELAKALTLSGGGSINDPVTFTVTVGFTDTGELKVFYPDEDVEIHPSNISISGTTATVEIPRARLIDPSLNDNRKDALSYDDDANFLTTVDVKRVYYDSTQGLQIVTYDCNGAAQTVSATPIIRNCRLSIIDFMSTSCVVPGCSCGSAWYQSGVHSPGCKYRGIPSRLRIYYVSGRQSNMSIEIDTIRLAHTLMPYAPADCEPVRQYWQKDVEVKRGAPTTPYGDANGAIRAWVSDSRERIGVGGMVS